MRCPHSTLSSRPRRPSCLGRGWGTAQRNGVVSFRAAAGASAARFVGLCTPKSCANAAWAVAAAPHTGMLRPPVLGSCWELQRHRTVLRVSGTPPSRGSPIPPPCAPTIPTRLSAAPGSLPSLPLAFRCTNPRARTLPLQPVQAMSPPPPRRWARPAARTPRKRRRQPCKGTPATTPACPPILTSGTCEGSGCPARDWTKRLGNEAERTSQAHCSSPPRKWSFHTDDRIGLVNCQEPEGGGGGGASFIIIL